MVEGLSNKDTLSSSSPYLSASYHLPNCTWCTEDLDIVGRDSHLDKDSSDPQVCTAKCILKVKWETCNVSVIHHSKHCGMQGDVWMLRLMFNCSSNECQHGVTRNSWCSKNVARCRIGENISKVSWSQRMLAWVRCIQSVLKPMNILMLNCRGFGLSDWQGTPS